MHWPPSKAKRSSDSRRCQPFGVRARQHASPARARPELAGRATERSFAGRLALAEPAGFLRLVTNPRLFANPEPIADAWEQVTAWLGCDPAWIPAPTEKHVEILGRLLAGPGIHANLVPDARLAAPSVEHGLILCSTDGDFGRFSGPRWQNPLA